MASAVVLFVYGTLMDPALCGRLLGRQPVFAPGAVAGARRAAVRAESYPALVADPTAARLDGLWLLGLGAADLKRLDRYEGSSYRRGPVRPVSAPAEVLGGEFQAQAYWWCGAPERLGGPWTPPAVDKGRSEADPLGPSQGGKGPTGPFGGCSSAG